MQSDLNDKKWFEIYQKTNFWVKDPNGKLICFSAKNADQFPFLKHLTFAIITAYNPMNQVMPEEENEKQNLLLEKKLSDKGYVFYKTSGELNGHRESSFTVEKISESEAVNLGLEYRQHSILYNDAKGVRFVRCCHA